MCRLFAGEQAVTTTQPDAGLAVAYRYDDVPTNASRVRVLKNPVSGHKSSASAVHLDVV